MTYTTLLAGLICFAGTALGSAGELVRITREDGSNLVGEILSRNPPELTVLNLKTRREETLNRSVVKVTSDPSNNAIFAEIQLADFLGWKLKDSLGQPLTGKIAASDLGTFYVNLGKSHGVQTGQRYSVYRGSERILDPDTGDALGVRERKIGSVVITETRDRLSKAKLADNIEAELKVGDLIRPEFKARRIAVLPFLDDRNRITAGARRLNDDLISVLGAYGIKVVERQEMVRVLTELSLQHTTVFDNESRGRVGKQTGAYAILTGSLNKTSARRVRVSARLVNVETGAVIKAESFDSPSGTMDLTSVVSAESVYGMKYSAPTGASEGSGRGSDTNLVPRINAASHVYKGRWVATGGGLVAAARGASCVAIPTSVTGSYRVSFEMTRASGNGSLLVCVPVGNRNCQVVYAGRRDRADSRTAIQWIYKRGDKTSRTFSAVPIRSGGRIRYEIDVSLSGSNATIVAKADGQEVARWAGATAQLASDAAWTPPNRSWVGIGTPIGGFTLHSASVDNAP